MREKEWRGAAAVFIARVQWLGSEPCLNIVM